MTELIREKIEEQADAVIGALFDALEADQGIGLAVKGGGMDLALIPDHRTRITAARELLDRVYGKPKQATEISGPDGVPLAAAVMFTPPEEWRGQMVDLARQSGALPPAEE